MSSITMDPAIFGGKPIIKGTRITIDLIGSYINQGYGIDEIMNDFPHLTKNEIISALKYIENNTRKERGKLESKTS